MVFYLLQIFAFVGLQMLLDGATTSSSTTCSGSDKTAQTIARILMWGLLILGFIPAMLVFGNGFEIAKKARGDKWAAKLIGALLVMSKHVAFLTLGIWDPESLQSYKIIEKAEKYDDDPTDTDSRQEAVIGIVARTRAVRAASPK